jgi:outer membrane protein TolC
LQITQNRFDAGLAARSDLLQAETQLANARIDQLTLTRQRATLEHAIAVLLGKAASDFTLPAAEWKVVVPDVPAGVPSTLLQRRPDIAAAERRVAAANAQIGIARSAYFPSLNLTGSYGYAAASSAGLFNASNNLWSLGLSAAQTLFDAGATKARVAGPKPSVMPPLPSIARACWRRLPMWRTSWPPPACWRSNRICARRHRLRQIRSKRRC